MAVVGAGVEGKGLLLNWVDKHSLEPVEPPELGVGQNYPGLRDLDVRMLRP